MNRTNYGIVGDGYLATHFAHYLDLEGIPFNKWSRRVDNISPVDKLSECDIILLLISDGSIEQFIEDNRKLKEKIIIHFSGALVTDKAIGFHPLMTFSDTLYNLEHYRAIPIIGSKTSKPFHHYFPKLKNSYHVINEDQKPLYHALCVLSGNLTTILWQKAFKDFETELNLPTEILIPYLKQVTENIKNNPETALTGPIKRQDRSTMKRNKKALKSRLWQQIYTLFNRVYKKENQ